MESLLGAHQNEILAVVTYGGLVFFALAEFLFPHLKAQHKLHSRWLTNIVLGVGNTILLAVLAPLGSLLVSVYARSEGWGLMNWLDVPVWANVILGVLLIDLIKYGEHVVAHQTPIFWRMHVVHHADLDIDFTTGFRHHPIEAVVGLLVASVTVLAFGIHPVAVLIFELLAGIGTIYTHTNVHIGPRLDRLLRCVFVTRDAHMVHHSREMRETNSNYGVIFLFWDRLFGTYCETPEGGIEGMTLGLEYFRDERELDIDRVLTMPFRVPNEGFSAAQDADRQPAPPAP